jgi:hypothetical protein
MNPLVDLCIGLVAVLALVRATRRPRPVHRTTAFFLALIPGALLWANLRPTGCQADLGGVDPPEALDPVTRALFWRGWPLSPCMVCPVHGLRFHPSSVERCVLVLDCVLFVVVLLATKTACERRLRRLQERNT